MNIFLRELTNRLISYLIRVSKGDTQEEKQIHLLKKSLLFSFMALLMASTMTSKYFVIGWHMNDLEKAITKIDVFMGSQQDNINQLFRINKDQYTELERLTKENAELRSDMTLVIKANGKLEQINSDLEHKLKKK